MQEHYSRLLKEMPKSWSPAAQAVARSFLLCFVLPHVLVFFPSN